MTVDERFEQLECKTQRLDKRNKRLAIALTMMAVTICAVVTMEVTGLKDGHFDTVTADVVIAQRAEIGVVTARYINLKNDTGDYVVRLRANPAGDGEISTHSAKGNDLVVLTATVDGNGVVTTYHPDGKTLVKLTATVNGGMVKTYQPNGKMLVDLSSNDNGGVVEVYNKTGKGIAQMGADEYGNGKIGAYNRKGEGPELKPGP